MVMTEKKDCTLEERAAFDDRMSKCGVDATVNMLEVMLANNVDITPSLIEDMINVLHEFQRMTLCQLLEVLENKKKETK